MNDNEVPSALPILGSALLDLEQERHEKERGLPNLCMGNKDVDDEVGSIWNEAGVLIGIAGVREGMAEEVAKTLIISHLKSIPNSHRISSPIATKVYLITSPTSPLSPLTLAHHISPSSESSLNSILWLRYLDLLGLIECVTEVISTLSEGLASPTPYTPSEILVIISSIDVLLRPHLTTHSLSSTASLTSQLFRSLHHLSTSMPWVKIIVTTRASTGYLRRGEEPISAFEEAGAGVTEDRWWGKEGESRGKEVVALTDMGRGVLGRIMETAVGNWVLVLEKDSRWVVEGVRAGLGERLGWGIWN
ncbi:MAG: hypothetical protein Q9160_001444 [Pyrenula sp. 1 TL-2023]